MKKVYDILLRDFNSSMVDEKYDFIESVIGKENICLSDTIDKTRIGSTDSFMMTIRCTDEEWEEIRFQLDLKLIWG